jgi:hypothetical protein
MGIIATGGVTTGIAPPLLLLGRPVVIGPIRAATRVLFVVRALIPLSGGTIV